MIQGLLYDTNRKTININIHTCKEKDVQPGESCMSEEEVNEYFRTKSFFFQILHTFIDYNDIDHPVKTIPGKLWTMSLSYGTMKDL